MSINWTILLLNVDVNSYYKNPLFSLLCIFLANSCDKYLKTTKVAQSSRIHCGIVHQN